MRTRRESTTYNLLGRMAEADKLLQTDRAAATAIYEEIISKIKKSKKEPLKQQGLVGTEKLNFNSDYDLLGKMAEADKLLGTDRAAGIAMYEEMISKVTNSQPVFAAKSQNLVCTEKKDFDLDVHVEIDSPRP